MVEVDRQLQRENLDILVKNGGFKFTNTFFLYTSGEIGPYFINSEVVMKDGLSYRTAINSLVKLIKNIEPQPEVISCGESRDWCFGPNVATTLGLPCTMIYKDGKVIGASMQNRLVLHVADLNNEGSSPKDKWIPTIREAGGRIEDIVFYVDRFEDGVKVMQELKLRSYAVVPLDQEAWDYLSHFLNTGVTPQILEQLKNRMEMGKDNWALQMLGSEAGKKRWAELYKDERTKVKAESTASTYIKKFPNAFSQEYFDKLKV
jgi:orotate phosphoribosyltransferase